MAKLATEPACTGTSGTTAPAPISSKRVASASAPRKGRNKKTPQNQLLQCSTVRAPNLYSSGNGKNERGMDKDKFFKELGMFSLKKKIEDAVARAEMLTPAALEFEEAEQIKQEQIVRDSNLWDDPTESNEMLSKLAHSTRVVDGLKDLRYKAEEAKLITQLAEHDAINYMLFKQAYDASLDVGKLLDQYEMSKLLKGPYEMEGACLIVKAGSEGRCPEIWAEKLFNMYTKWAEKQGFRGRVVEKHPSKNGGISCTTIEFETEYAYGYLLGERGIHSMISSFNGSAVSETTLAAVDVIPLFLDTACDLQINNKELRITYSSSSAEKRGLKPTVRIQHIPTGICFQSSGERNQLANKMKALDRLKAKLLVTAKEQGVADISGIKRDEIGDTWRNEIRRYVFYPNKLVEDVRTGMQMPALSYVLQGNIEPLIEAHINIRHSATAFL